VTYSISAFHKIKIKYHQAWWLLPIISATWRMKIGLWFKQDCISKNKLGMVVLVYNASYTGGGGRRIIV
jgi:hypothetical protein